MVKLKDICHPFSSENVAAMTAIHAVYEGLIFSAESGFVVGQIKQKYPTIRVHREQNYENNTYRIAVDIENTSNFSIEQFHQLLILVNNLGWFFSWQQIYPRNLEPGTRFNTQEIISILQGGEFKTIELAGEAKYDTEVTKVPDVLFHATPTKNAEKIKRIGLVPGSKNEQLSFPDRIHLAMNQHNLETVLIPALAKANQITNWTIFKVKYLNNLAPPLRLFKDPTYPLGYYTLTNISPHKLERVKDIVVPLERNEDVN